MNTEVYNNIKRILEKNTKARYSDNVLLAVYYWMFESIDIHNTSVSEFYKMMEEKRILTSRYIQRIARKVKEENPHLKGNPESRERLESEYQTEFTK